MPDSTKVSASKPAIGGAIYVESASTSTLPTAADTQITGFNEMGYVSEDGVVNANTFDSEDIKEWGGATVLPIEKNFADKFTFMLLEALNVNVLKEVFGEENVTGTLETGITITVRPGQHRAKKWIIDTIMRDGALKRMCIPSGTISSLAEINYKNDNAVGYKITLTCTPDASGNTHYEYIKAV